jgi:uncharacterized protein YkwD
MANIFDLEGARSAGASDTQIADFLANKLSFDIAGAREAGASDDQITDFLATKTAPKLKEQPKEATAGSELLAGGERYASSYKTAVEAFTGDPVAATREAIKRQEDIVRRRGQARGLDETRKAYEERGVLGAGAEVASQIPAALTGQGANLAVMGAGALAGAPGGPITAALGALSTQVVPFFEQNLIAQLRAQEERGEPVDLNRAKAAAYAAVQASAEIGGTVLAFGGKLIGRIIGTKPAAEATEALVKTAQQSLLAASGKGAVRATGAEIPVEMAQTILQRHQAGESLTNDDALEDYKNTIYGTILVAGPLGAGAGPVNRMQARSELDRRELAKTQTEETDRELGETSTESKLPPETPEQPEDIEKKLAGIEATSTDFVEPTPDDLDGFEDVEGTNVAPPVIPPAPIVQGDQNVAGQPVAGGVGVSPEVSGQPGGVPAAGVGGVDGTGVAVVGDTGAPPQAGTAGQPGALTSVPVQEVTPDATTTGQPSAIDFQTWLNQKSIPLTSITSQEQWDALQQQWNQETGSGSQQATPAVTTPAVTTPAVTTPAPVQEAAPVVATPTAVTAPAPIKTETDTGLDVKAEKKVGLPIHYIKGYKPTPEPSVSNFLNQTTLYNDAAPLTVENGIKTAATYQVFDMYDSARGSVQNALRREAGKKNKELKPKKKFSAERPLEFMTLGDM